MVTTCPHGWNGAFFKNGTTPKQGKNEIVWISIRILDIWWWHLLIFILHYIIYTEYSLVTSESFRLFICLNSTTIQSMQCRRYMSWATCCGVSDWGSPWAVNQQKMSHSTYHCSGSKRPPIKMRKVGNLEERWETWPIPSWKHVSIFWGVVSNNSPWSTLGHAVPFDDSSNPNHSRDVAAGLLGITHNRDTYYIQLPTSLWGIWLLFMAQMRLSLPLRNNTNHFRGVQYGNMGYFLCRTQVTCPTINLAGRLFFRQIKLAHPNHQHLWTYCWIGF